MPRSAARIAVVLAAAFALVGCATTAGSAALQVGTQATLDGRVVRVDTSPWAYDGSAVLTLASDTRGSVDVHFPARWNLCKAPPVDALQTLAAGDRVRVTGSVTAPAQLVVCERAEHGLRRLD